MTEVYDKDKIATVNTWFSMVPNPSDPENPESQLCISLSVGPLKGALVEYGKFKLNNPDTDHVTASFEYTIVYVPEAIKDINFTDEQGEEFENMLGDILICLLLQKHQQNEEDDNTRDTDTLTFNIL
jgi:hypothetical protein